MPERFCIMCNSTVCIPNFLFSTVLLCRLALDSADPTDRFAVLRREVGPSENPNLSRSSVQPCHWMKFYTKEEVWGKREAKKIMPKISAAMQFTRFLFSFAVFHAKIGVEFL